MPPGAGTSVLYNHLTSLSKGQTRGTGHHSPQDSMLFESLGEPVIRKPALSCARVQPLAAGPMRGQCPLPQIDFFCLPFHVHIYILFAELP